MRFYKGRERASQTSNSSHVGTALTEIAPHAFALSALDHEPAPRQRARLMGRSLSSQPPAFTGWAAPPPSLAITDALRRRRSS